MCKPCMCMCVFMCVHACVNMYTYMKVHVCLYVHVCVHATIIMNHYKHNYLGQPQQNDFFTACHNKYSDIQIRRLAIGLAIGLVYII